MRKTTLAIMGLLLIAVLADAIVVLRIPLDPVRTGAVFASLSLVLGAFVGLTDSRLVGHLRHWALESPGVAWAMPLALLVPYLIYAFGTGTFSLPALFRLTAYIAVPVSLVMPDRLHRSGIRLRAGWRDFAAMLALAVPIPAHWLKNVWTWPQELYFFQPLTCVCVGAYTFLVLRHLDDVGYKLLWRRGDWADGLSNFVAFFLLAIPLGYALSFIHFRPHPVSLTIVLSQFLGIYLTIAIPEELFFRGIMQNILVKTIGARAQAQEGGKGRAALLGLLTASLLFGASHLHHPPVPNWRYGIMATLAGFFYGNAYRLRHRLPASALTHALVDTFWHFWF